MRHLGSVVLTLVISPLVLALTGRGVGAFLDATGESPGADPLAVVTALAALGLAGMLFTLLALPRFSPLGPLLAAAGYLTLGAVTLLEPDRVAAAQPWVLLGLDRAAATITGALALVIAMPLLLSVFSAQRWTGPQPADAPAQTAPGGYPPPAYAAPSYPPPGYPPTGYPPTGYPQPGYPQPGYPQPGYPPPASYAQPGYPPPAAHHPPYRRGPDPTLEMSLGNNREPHTEPHTEPIETIRQPAPAGTVEPPTLETPTDDEPTQVSAADEPTEVPPSAEPTDASPSAEPTEEPTEDWTDEPDGTLPTEAETTESPAERSTS